VHAPVQHSDAPAHATSSALQAFGSIQTWEEHAPEQQSEACAHAAASGAHCGISTQTFPVHVVPLQQSAGALHAAASGWHAPPSSPPPFVHAASAVSAKITAAMDHHRTGRPAFTVSIDGLLDDV
jgi:hypothetical protein